MQNLEPEILEAFRSVLDEKLDELTFRLSTMVDQRIADLEGVQQQILQIKEEFNETVNHVEHVLQKDIDLTWE